MKHTLLCFAAIITSIVSTAQLGYSSFIHVDQFGYLPEAPKVAVLANPEVGFNSDLSYMPSGVLQLINSATSEVVYEAEPVSWNNGAVHEQSGDVGWWFDFSSVTEEGNYYIYDPEDDLSSHSFAIDDNVYNDVLTASCRMFYYNRCGIAKPVAYTGENWSDEMSFAQDNAARYVYDQNNDELLLDLSGGWFDAGDYNKYVTFALSAVHNLIHAFKENPSSFGDDYNIPESGNGVPDIIDELAWEYEWLLKMVQESGATLNKIGSIGSFPNDASPPSENTNDRFYGPTCTSSSIAMAIMAAEGALLLQEFPLYEDLAANLAEVAPLCFSYATDAIYDGTLEEDCDDGTIQAGDADWDAEQQTAYSVAAAIYLMELTGDPYAYHMENYLVSATPLDENYWTPYDIVIVDALIRFIDLPQGDPAMQEVVLTSLQNFGEADWVEFLRFNDLDLYRSHMPDWAYHWGSNSPKAGFGVMNNVFASTGEFENLEEDFRLKASQQLHYFHGVNPLGMVHLSNMYSYGAENSVNEIYHAWFHDGTDYDHALDSPLGPPPGYVTGGPNTGYSANTSLSPPYDQPPQKSYLDFNTSWPDNSWEISEPAIYYQAFYIRLLAQYASFETTIDITEEEKNQSFFQVQNPILDVIKVNSSVSKGQYQLLSLEGSEIERGYFSSNQFSLSIHHLASGTYLLLLETQNGVVQVEKVIIL